MLWAGVIRQRSPRAGLRLFDRLSHSHAILERPAGRHKLQQLGGAGLLEEEGLLIKQGTIVDATVLAVRSSAKNRATSAFGSPQS
jgi:hypothetical protein